MAWLLLNGCFWADSGTLYLTTLLCLMFSSGPTVGLRRTFSARKPFDYDTGSTACLAVVALNDVDHYVASAKIVSLNRNVTYR